MTIYRRPHDLPAHLACWRCLVAEAKTPAGLCASCREQLIEEDR